MNGTQFEFTIKSGHSATLCGMQTNWTRSFQHGYSKYVKDKEKNISRLMEYAELCG